MPGCRDTYLPYVGAHVGVPGLAPSTCSPKYNPYERCLVDPRPRPATSTSTSTRLSERMDGWDGNHGMGWDSSVPGVDHARKPAGKGLGQTRASEHREPHTADRTTKKSWSGTSWVDKWLGGWLVGTIEPAASVGAVCWWEPRKKASRQAPSERTATTAAAPSREGREGWMDGGKTDGRRRRKRATRKRGEEMEPRMRALEFFSFWEPERNPKLKRGREVGGGRHGVPV
ncbi:uncharacterized protein J3D65DRAFT_301461 [Phyllosticta citribraziliensis]|uniref:Uncharacterized protein n=1 Tax=Phyllosticta citribraziliensis TaxID=989973 RepID=A0ABR1LZ25_9PEZI